MLVQVVLGIISIGSLMIKKFMPGENRTWKVFLLDISKQGVSALVAHFVNLLLALYLHAVLKEGNGCVWYLINLTLDCFLGVLIAYGVFSIVNNLAIRFDIDVLKSGVYTHKSVSLIDGKEEVDDAIDMRIWAVQLIVWIICTLIAKVVIFFFILAYHKEMVYVGNSFLSIFKGHPRVELVFVMIIIPLTFNAMQFWIQDNFLKGDDHVEERKAGQFKRR